MLERFWDANYLTLDKPSYRFYDGRCANLTTEVKYSDTTEQKIPLTNRSGCHMFALPETFPLSS